jgi:hypothetical protein
MEVSEPCPASKTLLRKVEDMLFPLFWHAQCSTIPTESRSFYEVAVFLRLHAHSRFVSGLARDRSSTRFAGTHFTARSGDRFHRRLHNGNGGVVIFDPSDFGGDYDLPSDDTVYQGQIAPQDAENLPYAMPTSDPDIVISPYLPHAAIRVAGIPHEATVRDPVSIRVFLNP